MFWVKAGAGSCVKGAGHSQRVGGSDEVEFWCILGTQHRPAAPKPSVNITLGYHVCLQGGATFSQAASNMSRQKRPWSEVGAAAVGAGAAGMRAGSGAPSSSAPQVSRQGVGGAHVTQSMMAICVGSRLL